DPLRSSRHSAAASPGRPPPVPTCQATARLGACAHGLVTRKYVHAMTIADITLAAFTLCNSLRFAAYIPQITSALRDQRAAQAIPFAAWSIFLVSRASAMNGTLVDNEQWTIGSMFWGNVSKEVAQK